MGRSKKQKSQKIVQHILPQIIIPIEPVKVPSAPSSPIQIVLDKPRSEYLDEDNALIHEPEETLSDRENVNSGNETTNDLFNRNHKRIIDNMETKDRNAQKKIRK